MTPDEFARARLDETEQAARAAAPGPWYALDGGVQTDDGEHWPVADTAVGPGLDRPTRVHIAANDPGRVLAWVAAIRAILDEHADQDDPDDQADGPCSTVRHVAAIWAYHPDYQREWTP